jgi:S1-C subfamily serine protease
LKGVVITHIGEQSPMREVGLEEGDLIQAFNQRAVTSVEEFKGLLKSIRVGDLVRIQILRGNAAFLTTFQAPR